MVDAMLKDFQVSCHNVVQVFTIMQGAINCWKPAEHKIHRRLACRGVQYGVRRKRRMA